MNRTVFISMWLICLSFTAVAQVATPQHDKAQTLLELDADSRALWREHTDAVAALNEQYSQALAAHSKEHSRRLNALSQKIAAEHTQLSAEESSSAERQNASGSLQLRHKNERQQLAEWNVETTQRLAAEHNARQAEQRAVHDTRLLEFQNRKAAILQLQLNRPVNLTSIPPATTDTDEPAPEGETAESASDGEIDEPDTPMGPRFVRIEPGFTMTGATDAIIREWTPISLRIPTTFRMTGLGDAPVREFEPLVYRLPETFTMTGTAQ